MSPSEPEVADDPERDCREAEAPGQGRLQGPALRGNADPAGRLVVPALPAQLSRHRGTVPGARPGGGPLHPEPLGPGLCPAHREETAAVPQALLQICDAGPDWVDVPSRKAHGGASVMTQGKEFKGRQFTAEGILCAVR